jgi:hypothetical protein
MPLRVSHARASVLAMLQSLRQRLGRDPGRYGVTANFTAAMFGWTELSLGKSISYRDIAMAKDGGKSYSRAVRSAILA